MKARLVARRSATRGSLAPGYSGGGGGGGGGGGVCGGSGIEPLGPGHICSTRFSVRTSSLSTIHQ